MSHYHCPDGCEKPQPQEYLGILVCGRCLHKYNEALPVVPCTPQICPNEKVDDMLTGEICPNSGEPYESPPEPVPCHYCKEPSVGYDDGRPICAKCYQSIPTFMQVCGECDWTFPCWMDPTKCIKNIHRSSSPQKGR
jgi:hypothetical protein